MAYPLYRVVFPLPPSPYPAMALIVPVWLAVGLLVWAFVRVRKPALLQDIGMVLGLAETGGAAIDAEERLGDGALVETAVADGE